MKEKEFQNSKGDILQVKTGQLKYTKEWVYCLDSSICGVWYPMDTPTSFTIIEDDEKVEYKEV